MSSRLGLKAFERRVSQEQTTYCNQEETLTATIAAINPNTTSGAKAPPAPPTATVEVGEFFVPVGDEVLVALAVEFPYPEEEVS